MHCTGGKGGDDVDDGGGKAVMGQTVTEAASVEEAAERGAWPRAKTWAELRKPSARIARPHLPKSAAPNRLNL